MCAARPAVCPLVPPGLSVRLSHQERWGQAGGRGSFVFMDEENDTWTQTHNL